MFKYYIFSSNVTFFSEATRFVCFFFSVDYKVTQKQQTIFMWHSSHWEKWSFPAVKFFRMIGIYGSSALIFLLLVLLQFCCCHNFTDWTFRKITENEIFHRCYVVNIITEARFKLFYHVVYKEQECHCPVVKIKILH